MASKRPSLPQLKKYDVTEKVISALTNVESRAILFASVRKEQTVSDLSRTLRIPLSTVYKKVSELAELTLISERIVMHDDGGKVKMCKSRIKAAEIHINRTEPHVTLVPNR